MHATFSILVLSYVGVFVPALAVVIWQLTRLSD
jgi:hypothetical protein